MKAQIVSFRCILRDDLGTVISSTFNRDVITQLPNPHLPLPGLDAGLRDLKGGEHRKIRLPAAQAYGLYDPRLSLRVSRKRLSRGPTLEVGDKVVGRAPDGKVLDFRVIAADAGAVTLDGNHPLAGQDLTFDIEALEAREASAEEIADSLPRVVPAEFAGGYLH